MSEKIEYPKSEMVEICGKNINIAALKIGGKKGKKVTKEDFVKSFPVKKIPKKDKDGEFVFDKDGKQQYIIKPHPRLDEIWAEIEKLLKK